MIGFKINTKMFILFTIHIDILLYPYVYINI